MPFQGYDSCYPEASVSCSFYLNEGFEMPSPYYVYSCL